MLNHSTTVLHKVFGNMSQRRKPSQHAKNTESELGDAVSLQRSFNLVCSECSRGIPHFYSTMHIILNRKYSESLKIWVAENLGVPQDNGVGAPATLAKINELRIEQFSMSRTCDTEQWQI